jgi:hypothetical protein
MYSPYNNTRAYHPWGGEDCSYLFAYAFAERKYMQMTLPLFIVFFGVVWNFLKVEID